VLKHVKVADVTFSDIDGLHRKKLHRALGWLDSDRQRFSSIVTSSAKKLAWALKLEGRS